MLGREKLSVLSRFLFTALSKKFITHVESRSFTRNFSHIFSYILILF